MACSANIREASAADLAAVQQIYAHHVLTGTASFELEAPTVDEMRIRFAAIRDKGYPYLVAEVDGEVVGYAYAGPYRPRPAYAGTVENSVYVRHDQAGRGIGRLLLERLIGACEERGYREMVAVIGDSANEASIRLHAGQGFAMVGTLRGVGRKFGQWLDTVLMQRPLGPRA